VRSYAFYKVGDRSSDALLKGDDSASRGTLCTRALSSRGAEAEQGGRWRAPAIKKSCSPEGWELLGAFVR